MRIMRRAGFARRIHSYIHAMHRGQLPAVRNPPQQPQQTDWDPALGKEVPQKPAPHYEQVCLSLHFPKDRRM